MEEEKKTFNRSDLVTQIAVKCEVSEEQAEAFVHVFIETVSTKLAKGYKVTLMNFLTLRLLHKESRTLKGLGQKFKVAAKRVVRVTVSEALTERVQVDSGLKIKETGADALAKKLRTKT